MFCLQQDMWCLLKESYLCLTDFGNVQTMLLSLFLTVDGINSDQFLEQGLQRWSNSRWPTSSHWLALHNHVCIVWTSYIWWNVHHQSTLIPIGCCQMFETHWSEASLKLLSFYQSISPEHPPAKVIIWQLLAIHIFYWLTPISKTTIWCHSLF